MDLLIKGPDGKPIFVGREDPSNPPVKNLAECQHGGDKCSHLQCPKCKTYVDYLLGQNAKGCETCYDKSKDSPVGDSGTVDESKVIL